MTARTPRKTKAASKSVTGRTAAGKKAAPRKSTPKAAAKKPVARRAASKANTTTGNARPAPAAKPVVLLSGGNPQIAKAEGDAPVQAYIAAMPGWKSDLGRRLDALIVRTVPRVHKAVKWNSPFYGVEGKDGWFLSFHTFTNYVKVTFFRGTSLRPVPPGESKHKAVRYLDIRQEGFDEAQFKAWVKQASRLPGERL